MPEKEGEQRLLDGPGWLQAPPRQPKNVRMPLCSLLPLQHRSPTHSFPKVKPLSAVMQNRAVSTCSSRAFNPHVTQNPVLTPGSILLHLLLHQVPVPCFAHERIEAAACKQAGSSVHQWGFPEENRQQHLFSCWKLNASIKSRTPRLAAWNRCTTAEGLSPLPFNFFCG